MSIISRRLLIFIFLLFNSSEAFSFVYLSPSKPHLFPADGRTQIFYLTPETPIFQDKNTFEGGTYANDSDGDVFVLLVQRAMNFWNQIPGLAIELKVANERRGVIEPQDNVFSVGPAQINATASGLAYPIIDEQNTNRIRDCDIQVATGVDSIPAFLFVLVHEFGHCLGLGHNHSDPNAIMGYWQPKKNISLGLDDVAGVLSLYPPVAGEKTQTFAPCGSLSLVQTATFVANRADESLDFAGELSRRARALSRIGALLILMLPLGAVGCRNLFLHLRRCLGKS